MKTTFSRSSISTPDLTLSASWAVKLPTVWALVEMDGTRFRVRFDASHPLHAAALAAADGETVEVDTDAAMDALGTADPVGPSPVAPSPDPAPAPHRYYSTRQHADLPADALASGDLERPAYLRQVGRLYSWVDLPRALSDEEQITLHLVPAEDAADALRPRERKPRPELTEEQRAAKQAHGPVPEKLWIGSSLEGRHYRILFDAEYDRTRIIFDRKPAPAVLSAVKAAGFYWSPTMRSWNKGLTCRAYRAAQALHQQLQQLRA